MRHDEIVQQLTEIYFRKDENYHKEILPKEEADKYHDKLLTQGSIITVSDGNVLCGFVEVWRISFSQFGRIICGEPFSAFNENILNGQLAYVGDTYIRTRYRDGEVAKMLRDRFFEMNSDCTHFCGTARRKKSAPVKVFKREDIKSLNKEKMYV